MKTSIHISCSHDSICGDLTQAHRKRRLPFAAYAFRVTTAVQLKAGIAAEARQLAARSQIAIAVGDLGQRTVALPDAKLFRCCRWYADREDQVQPDGDGRKRCRCLHVFFVLLLLMCLCCLSTLLLLFWRKRFELNDGWFMTGVVLRAQLCGNLCMLLSFVCVDSTSGRSSGRRK